MASTGVPVPRGNFRTFSLLLFEDTQTSQVAQSPAAARRLINFIPSRALDLKRKPFAPPFSRTLRIEDWWSFVQDFIFYIDGEPKRQIIAVYSDNIGSKIVKFTADGAWAFLPAGAGTPPGNPLAGWRADPLLLYSDGLLFITDGVEATIYDGTNTRSWGLQQIPLPVHFDTVVLAALAGGPLKAIFTGTGLNDLTVNPTADAQPVARVYRVEIAGDGTPNTFKWRRDADPIVEDVEITGNPQTLEDGVIITFASTTGHTVGDVWEITVLGFPCEFFREYLITEFDSVAKRESMPGPRTRFVPAVSGMYSVPLVLPPRKNIQNGWTSGVTDKFRIYASHVDGSTKLFLLAEVASTELVVFDPLRNYRDNSGFYGEANTKFTPFEPAFRNQPIRLRTDPAGGVPLGGYRMVGVKFHNRFSLTDPRRRSRVWISGFGEIIEQGDTRGNPLETFPGAKNDTLLDLAAAEPDQVKREGILNNLSDFENWVELPDEQFEVRAELWFQDGVIMGTEKTVKTLWGRNPEDPYRISPTSTYGFGVFHKNAFLYTTHGLVIFTADRRLVLDPVLGATEGDRTSQVMDIGWPKQREFDKTDITFTNRFQMRHWKFGSERDWLVIAYTTQNAIDGGKARCIVYDFQTQGWMTFDDVHPTMLGIVQEDGGHQFLVGGNNRGQDPGETPDRKMHVLDGFTSDAASAYQAAAARIFMPAPSTFIEIRPHALYRTSLFDLGIPDRDKGWDFLRLYMKPNSPVPTVRIWFDPFDVENLPGADGNLGAADRTLFPPGTNGAINDPNDPAVAFDFKIIVDHSYLGNLEVGRMAKRAIMEFELPAGTPDGAIQGIEIMFQVKGDLART